MPAFDITVPEYRYFVADFLTNTVITELPFKGVSFERAIKAAGKFSGTIPIIDKTMAYDLYESTMPGKTALYVVRNDQCVWGGIIWSRSYSLDKRELSVSGAEFTSYLHHRKIWKTYSHHFEASLTSSSGSCSVILSSGRFNFVAGAPIRIAFVDETLYSYNGYYTVASSPSPTSGTFSTTIAGLPTGSYSGVTVMVRVDTYDYVRQLLEEMLVDFSSINFANEVIEPAKRFTYTVTNKSLTDNVATLTIDSGHEVVPGPTITVSNVDSTFNGIHEVTAVTSTTVSYPLTASNVPSTAVSAKTGTVIARLGGYSSTNVILQFSGATTFSPGDVITVTGVDDASWTVPVYNGTHVIVWADNASIFGPIVSFSIDVTPPDEFFAACSGSATTGSGKVTYGTYGSFPANADFGLDFSTEAYSGEYISTRDKIRRGYELKTIGDELDEYSDTISGFEYRIDCDYDTATSSFTRTFYMYPINVPDTDPPTPVGEPSAIERFGAQNLVFEYPGNIMDATLDESAENAATRFFMVGSGDGLGADASQPYAAASAMTLLNEGWPLLDADDNRTEDVNADGTRTGTLDEERLYEYAERYLAEFQPPVGDFTVSVNGSLAPIVGSYSPGDWCSLILDDDFVRLRLASNLEPRSDILVRKIESYSVSVPDNPSFPEKVDLNLITEWQVDKRGE